MNLNKFMFSTTKSKIGNYIVGKTFESYSKVIPVNRVFENKFILAFWHPIPFLG